LKKLFGNKKGVSAAVATVIIISVTIAIAIAVAYWMAGLASFFTRITETELEFVDVIFGHQSNEPENEIVVLLRNPSQVTAEAIITQVRVNDKIMTFAGKSVLTNLEESALIIYNVGWVSGNQYQITIITSTGQEFIQNTTAP